MKTTLTEPFTGQQAPKSSQVHEERAKVTLSQRILDAQKEVEKDPDNPECWINLGKAYRPQQLQREAIECYSQGIMRTPFYGLLYRHRGHSYMNISRWAEAAADFTMATRLIPDNWDSWYHLGATLFFLGEFEAAEKVYVRCLEISYSEHQVVACTDWYWMTLRRLNKNEAAAQCLSRIADEITEEAKIDGGDYYHHRMMLYKGNISPETFEAGLINEGTMIATCGYGLANYYYVNGRHSDGDRIVQMILKDGEADTWAAFGYQAALADKNRRAL